MMLSDKTPVEKSAGSSAEAEVINGIERGEAEIFPHDWLKKMAQKTID